MTNPHNPATPDSNVSANEENSAQPYYPSTDSASGNSENSYSTEYGDYSAQTPSSNPFEKLQSEPSQNQSGSDYATNNTSFPDYNSNPYLNASANSQSTAQEEAYQDPYQDPYGTSASSANSWQNPDAQSPQFSSQQANYQQPYPQPYQQQQLNLKALLGLIFSFFFFPAGLILSWMGLRESKQEDDSTGKVMSIIGLVVSGLQTLLFLLWLGFLILAIVLGMAGA